MISTSTIDKIFDTILIEEVIGDFVTLKKDGANLKGLCPFHNEKTPSFKVSTSKQIYKCFGCGASGNSVNFLMKHEQFTYPEALKYLAKKYNIEIEETKPVSTSPAIKDDETESLYVINSFAQKYFSDLLFNTEEGKAIGLPYFKERGFSDETIKKFQLGYSLANWDALKNEAISKGFSEQLLEKAGLIIVKEDTKKAYDRFRERVIFPIHSLSGQVIGFGARILNADPKSPKYINSPETEIYHKNSVLYGCNFARNLIKKEDNCFLVEGYTDVISLHQAGIENTVASSGTSLTENQIQLIKRFTKNITILYDGDQAGIKAASRGIDLILESGLNVKIVLFPDNEDPDSYVKKIGADEFKKFINNNSKDFVLFKTALLAENSSSDPIKKAETIHDIVQSLSKIGDQIKKSLYIKSCSKIIDIEESVLISEMNKHINRQKHPMRISSAEKNPDTEFQKQDPVYNLKSEFAEKDLIRLLLAYSNEEIICFYKKSDTQPAEAKSYKVAQYIIDEIKNNDIEMEHKLCAEVIAKFEEQLSAGIFIDEKYFTQNSNPVISEFASDIVSIHYFISDNWKKKYDIYVPHEKNQLKYAVNSTLTRLKIKKIKKMMGENQKKINNTQSSDEQNKLQKIHLKLHEYLEQLANPYGTVVIK